jgi:hypothetical protein
MNSVHSQLEDSEIEYSWPAEEEEKEAETYSNNFDHEQSYDLKA